MIGNDLFISGIFNEGWGNVGNGLARWDGSNWHRMGDGVHYGAWGLCAIDDTLYVACGASDMVDGRPAAHYGAWAAGKWCPNTVPVTRFGSSSAAALFCTVKWNGQKIVGGFFDKIGNDSCSNIAILKHIDNCLQQSTGVSATTATSGTSFSCLPNPTDGAFTIQWNGAPGGKMHYVVTDATGRLMDETLSKAQQLIIRSDSWPSGMYFLRIWDENGDQRGKALKLLKQ